MDKHLLKIRKPRLRSCLVTSLMEEFLVNDCPCLENVQNEHLRKKIQGKLNEQERGREKERQGEGGKRKSGKMFFSRKTAFVVVAGRPWLWSPKCLDVNPVPVTFELCHMGTFLNLPELQFPHVKDGARASRLTDRMR